MMSCIEEFDFVDCLVGAVFYTFFAANAGLWLVNAGMLVKQNVEFFKDFFGTFVDA